MSKPEACACCLEVRQIISNQPYPNYTTKIMMYDVPFSLCFACDTKYRFGKPAEKYAAKRLIERNLSAVLLRNMTKKQIQSGEAFSPKK